MSDLLFPIVQGVGPEALFETEIDFGGDTQLCPGCPTDNIVDIH
ncbi:hypothetical protein [Nocardia xishanensis]|nr:hypothetical protein [Nocardia xishanensis]